MPEPVAIDALFSHQVTALADAQTSWAAQADSGSGRDWYRPDSGDGTGETAVSPDDAEAVRAAFSVDQLGAAYGQAADREGSGTVGEVACLRFQIDYMRTLGRAYRARHLSPVRAELFAASRRRGMGQAGTYGTVLRYAQDLLKAGQNNQDTTATDVEEGGG